MLAWRVCVEWGSLSLVNGPCCLGHAGLASVRQRVGCLSVGSNRQAWLSWPRQQTQQLVLLASLDPAKGQSWVEDLILVA